MTLHFKNHKENCACNKNFKNVAMSENWKDLEHGGCENCKRTDAYKMARQESPIEIFEAVNVWTQEQWDYISRFYGYKWKTERGDKKPLWNKHRINTCIYLCKNQYNKTYADIEFYKRSHFDILLFNEWQEKYDKPIKPIKHKNLRQAIKDKVNIKLRVTPGQSKIVQEIAFGMGYQWESGYDGYKSEIEPYLFIYSYFDNKLISYINNSQRFEKSGCKEFSLEDDSFVEDLPTVNFGGKFETKIHGMNAEISFIPDEPKEPKETTYTITENELTDMLKTCQDGIRCLVEYNENINEMKNDAIELKDSSLVTVALKIKNIINKIKNGG